MSTYTDHEQRMLDIASGAAMDRTRAKAKREPWMGSCYPSGCPDPDWCAGNRECHWDCAGLTEDDAP